MVFGSFPHAFLGRLRRGFDQGFLILLYLCFCSRVQQLFSSMILFSKQQCCSLLEMVLLQIFSPFGQFRASLVVNMIGWARIFIFVFVSVLSWVHMSSKPFKSGNTITKRLPWPYSTRLNLVTDKLWKTLGLITIWNSNHLLENARQNRNRKIICFNPPSSLKYL